MVSSVAVVRGDPLLEQLSLESPCCVEQKNDLLGSGRPGIVDKLILQRGGQTQSVPRGRSLWVEAIL